SVAFEQGLPGGLQVGDLPLGGPGHVADVLAAPGERVDDGEPAPLGRRQQPDAVGEVPRLRPGDPLALAVRLGEVHWRLLTSLSGTPWPARPPAAACGRAGSPSARRSAVP